ncbi:MAG: aminoacyl-tRNA hydrolase [Pirellulales bacterium]
MKLIVGLGNPGRKYEGTRHNVGFELLDQLSELFGGGSPRTKFNGLLIDISIGGEKAILLYPQTYMNNSGNCVRAAVDFYKIPLHDLLIACDDFNLPLNKLRLRANGSAGGQKGLADGNQKLSNEEFPRLRIGIGPLPEKMEVTNFVLGKFSKNERIDVEQVLFRARNAVVDWIEHDLTHSMNQHN